MKSWEFWDVNSIFAPELADMAQKISSLAVTTCAAERCWSEYAFIQDKKRNRLRTDRADKLVFLFSNARLMRKMTIAHWEAEVVE